MTIEGFSIYIRKKNQRRYKYAYYTLITVVIISFSLSFYPLIAIENTKKILDYKNYFYSISIILFCLLLFGVYDLNNFYKLSIWHNNLTKQKNIEMVDLAFSDLTITDIKRNENSVYFIYNKNWWTMPYEVYIFADKNILAVNVESQDIYCGGFISLGSNKRMQKKLLNSIKNYAQTHKD